MCRLIFLNSFDPAKKIKSEQLHHTSYAANISASVKKKQGLGQTLFGFTQKFCLKFIIKYNYFCCSLKLTLTVGGINSEHIGINNILFNYSCHSMLATEYEELKKKNATIIGSTLTMENTMNLIGHTVAFSEVLHGLTTGMEHVLSAQTHCCWSEMFCSKRKCSIVLWTSLATACVSRVSHVNNKLWGV